MSDLSRGLAALTEFGFELSGPREPTPGMIAFRLGEILEQFGIGADRFVEDRRQSGLRRRVNACRRAIDVSSAAHRAGADGHRDGTEHEGAPQQVPEPIDGRWKQIAEHEHSLLPHHRVPIES